MDVQVHYKQKYWSVNNPKVVCFEMYFETTVKKSRAGIEYTHYVPMIRRKTKD